MAQTALSGTVTDEDGKAINGVNVVVKGRKNGTVTDASGKFNLRVQAASGTLVFSHVNYTGKEAAFNAKTTTLNVRLAGASNEMEQVVVIGYGTQRRKDVTGALGGVNSEELNRNKTTDVLSALQGKIAGVQILSQSGELGAGFNIKIRGANSISGSSAPLFVIDGIPIDVNSNEVAGSTLSGSTTPNPLSNLNPQDIESIEVLKDASATAIYGSRGANGVVIVTTKTGKVGKSSVDYDGNIRFSNLSKKLSVLDGQGYLDYRRARYGDSDMLARQMDTTMDGKIDVPSHDWQDEVYRTGVTQNHTLSVSAGNKVTQFSGSLNFLNDNGIIINNNDRRYVGRLRVDHNASDKLKVGFNVNISNDQLNGSTSSGGAFTGVTRRVLFSRPVDIYSASDASDGYDTYISPVTDISNSQLSSNTTRMLGNANAAYKLAKNFTFNVIAGGGISDSKGKEFYSSQTTGGVRLNGFAVVQNVHTYNWTNTNQLTYNQSFGKSTLNVIGVFELSSYGFETSGMQGTNFAYQGTGVDDIAKASTITGISTYRYKNNRISYVSRANYNLNGKYLFTASIRADGSDKFGANNKYGYFPSGAFAWRLDNESFMDNVKAINTLKLRVSYGVTGNEKINPFTYLPLLDNYYYASNGTAQLGLAPSNPGNPDLKWEQSTSYNAGFDLGLWGDRLTVTADFYTKQVKNMLIKAQLPTQGGYYSQFKNLGRVDNSGVEVTVATVNIKNKNFTWNTDVNITYNKSLVKSLGGVDRQPVIVPGDINNLGQLIVGQQFGTGYGYIWDGTYQLSDFTLTNGVYTLNAGVPGFAGATVQPGSFKFRDISGSKGQPDGIIDSYDQTVISQSQPKFTGGFNSNLHYKQFDFAFFVQGVAGRQLLNMIKLDLTGFKPNRNMGSDFFYNRWTTTNPTNEYGTWSDLNATSRYNSTFYVEDASYLRLQSVTLGYTFDTKNWKSVKRLRAYVTGNNLLTITNYSGYDPEVTYKNDLLSGVDALAFPRSRTYIVGVSASF